MLYKLRYLLNRNRNYNTEVNKQQLEKMLKQGAILLDVRSPQEFQEDHLENAISLPEYEIVKKSRDILKNKLQVIIVYCNSGHRSKKAQKRLIKLGYENVYNLYEGLEEYY